MCTMRWLSKRCHLQSCGSSRDGTVQVLKKEVFKSVARMTHGAHGAHGSLFGLRHRFYSTCKSTQTGCLGLEARFWLCTAVILARYVSFIYIMVGKMLR